MATAYAMTRDYPRFLWGFIWRYTRRFIAYKGYNRDRYKYMRRTMIFSMNKRLTNGFVWFVLGITSFACQSTSSLDDPVSTTEPLESATDVETTVDSVTTYDLEQACNGIPVAGATAYDPSVSGIHPLLVFYRESATDSFVERSSYTPEAWEVPWQEAEKIELVACLTVTDRSLAQVCEFEDDEDNEVYKLEVHNTVYEAALYEAQTGKLVETQSFDAKASDTCPMLHMFSDGESVDQSDAGFEQPLIQFAKPYVQPAT